MRSRPAFPTDDTITRALAEQWQPVSEIAYLPWGFGAHHWRADSLFVTLDQLEPRHTAASLESTYASAAELAAAGLEFVCAPVPTRSGRFTVDTGAGALSVTPMLDGRSPAEDEVDKPAILAALDALHRTPPPVGLHEWAPKVGPGFADELRARTAEPWTSGPLAEEARTALASRGDAIKRWNDRYLELAALAASQRDSWVPTHGEPHHGNQVATPDGLRLVDWETLAVAPRERDYADLPGTPGLDPEMLELFALDWRLSELREYADWFSAPHTGNEDDVIAWEGLREELGLA
ncbi:phosphotransferase family protein [Amycolatopsis sp. Poz14]|uniref:phosphotransferase family protein n=1 Tax=Amycolatopsis sp. Poz14 TaxID=1447705 RepID=UPI001EE9536D|nr:aminoglycoside phosphotransferase family protein [Amycolatopsis sp. Poz14]MCG3752239.1 aminoglycoside phosphotransferase [Amycolatopsis sp. Poz14]